MRTIIGIDPGLAATGYGVIQSDRTGIRHLDHGVITTSPESVLGARLSELYDVLQDIIQRYHPDEAGVEALYFARNTSSAMPVAHARGVVLLALERNGIPASEYPPQSIKQALVGEGRADKSQIQQLVRVVLGLSGLPGPDHASDALAVAICHSNTSTTASAIKRGTERC